jgi:hypothetical protein
MEFGPNSQIQFAVFRIGLYRGEESRGRIAHQSVSDTQKE